MDCQDGRVYAAQDREGGTLIRGENRSLGKALPAVGSAGAGLVRLPIPKRKDQPTTHLGSAPGRAAGPLGLRSTR